MVNENIQPDESSKLDISIIMPVFNGEGFIEKSLPPLIEMKRRGEVTGKRIYFYKGTVIW